MLIWMKLVLGFVVIAAGTLLQCNGQGRPFNVAGEDTPVWTARCPHKHCDNKVKAPTYKRLDSDVIKKAFKYWKSDKFKGIPFTFTRPKRSIPDHVDYKTEFESVVGITTRSKRDWKDEQYGTVEASILVMAHYDPSAVKDDDSRRKYVKEKILYILAYWNQFNRAVYEIKGIMDKPHVQVKIVGIIIALDRNSVPYLNSSLTASDSLRLANKFWQKSPHKDFPRDSYHGVATMTDTEPYGSYGIFETRTKDSSNPSVIVWDLPNFVAFNSLAPLRYTEVGNHLRQWAYYFPKEYDYMRPGQSVEQILPGHLMSPTQQCRIRGYTADPKPCPDSSTNCDLWCVNNHWYSTCGRAGKALDGTPCVKGKIGYKSLSHAPMARWANQLRPKKLTFGLHRGITTQGFNYMYKN